MPDPVSDSTAAADSEISCRTISNTDIIWSAGSIEASRSARALLFESRGMLFALPAGSVTEVLEAVASSEVPGAPVWYRGVSVYRSQPVALIDVAKFLQPESPALAFNRAIAVSVASSTYLLAVEKILNLCNLPADLQQNPAYNNQHAALRDAPDYTNHRAVKSACRYDNRVLALIDLPELLRCTRLLRECAVT